MHKFDNSNLFRSVSNIQGDMHKSNNEKTTPLIIIYKGNFYCILFKP